MPKLFLFTLEVPNDSLRAWSLDDLPAYWNEESYERTQWLLRDWLNEPNILVAAVLSVVVPMSYNYLLNPAPLAFGQIRVVHQKPFPIDRPLW